MRKKNKEFLHLCGRIEPEPEEHAFRLAQLPAPLFKNVNKDIRGTGKGKIVVLSDYHKEVAGHYSQLVQEIGDCSSFGCINALNHTRCVEIAVKGQREEWEGEISTEFSYAASRVNIGNSNSTSDGSWMLWNVQALGTLGSVLRAKYENIDLTKYNPTLARQWGAPRVGVPKKLIEVAAQHKSSLWSLVETVDDARDAIANGYAIGISSNQGFTKTRDARGVCAASGTWPHVMCVIGVDDPAGLFCILNSWGNYMTGPTRHNSPQNAFWVEKNVIQNMLNERDSFTVGEYNGFPRRKLNLRIV